MVIVVPFEPEYTPQSGRWQTLFRTGREDKQTIRYAAAAVGMTTSAFVRTVVLHTAAQILREREEQMRANYQG